jgi:outer membrane protein, multidrug efflux system
MKLLPMQMTRRPSSRVTGLWRCIALALSSASLLVGCATPQWPAYERPALDMPAASARPVAVSPQWWQAFGDPVLDALVAEALANNADLKKTLASLDEARASLGMAQSALSPRLDAFGKAGLNKRYIDFNLLPEPYSKTSSSASAGLSASWEIDLWGRLSLLSDAALARVAASEHTRDAVTLSVSTAMVDAYFQLRALDNQLEILNGVSASLKAVTNLELRRWKAQMGTERAYRQSVAELAGAQSRYPPLEAAVRHTEMAIKFLAGRTPRQMSEPVPRGPGLPTLIVLPDEFDGDVLLRRPDVASAEQMLIAAHADVSAIRAERLPRLNLSSMASLMVTSSKVINGLPLFWDAAAGVSMPLFDGGLLENKADAATARRVRAEVHYRQVLSGAFRECHDAMIDREASEKRYVSLQRLVDTRKASLVLAERSYESGRSTKYEVLGETLKVYEAQLQLVDARLAQYQARSQFYKAVGGGF